MVGILSVVTRPIGEVKGALVREREQVLNESEAGLCPEYLAGSEQTWVEPISRWY